MRSQGRNRHLIRDLLGDAQLWDLLEKTCRKQISELTEFQESYKRLTILHETDEKKEKDEKNEEDEKNEKDKKDKKDRSASGAVVESLEEFSSKLTHLKKLYDEDLKALKEYSQDLIQLVRCGCYLAAGKCELTVGRNLILLPLQNPRGLQQWVRA